MREATGELNITFVVVLLVAGLVAFFYFVLWPIIDKNEEQQAKCSNAVCDRDTLDSNGFVDCKGASGSTFKCKYKG